MTVFDRAGGDYTYFGTWAIQFYVCNDTTTACPTTQPTLEPTTAEPTSSNPTTANPTLEPTTAEPTNEPTTNNPTTANPTTVDPTTDEPTSLAPSTAEPTTNNPTTALPTTSQPTIGIITRLFHYFLVFVFIIIFVLYLTGCGWSTETITFENQNPNVTFTDSIDDVINVSGVSGLVSAIDVEMKMDHPWVWDLHISLSYDGTSIVLISGQGSSGDHINVTVR